MECNATDLIYKFSLGCNPMKSDCSNGKCKRQSRSCKGESSCGNESEEEEKEGRCGEHDAN